MKTKIVDFILLGIFVIGVGILLYPTVSNYWNEYRNSKLISEYEKRIIELSDGEKQAILEEARAYNSQHKHNTISDGFDDDYDYVASHPYAEMLDPMGKGIMAYLQIPKINCNLAVYHGLGSKVLEMGLGHVEGTSLPVGGKGSHSVIAGHRALPKAKLFTELDQLKIKDNFFIKVIDETLAYEVDQIKVVLPNEVEELAIDPDKDYVTLVTCTPYSVNTHRLLLRGHRVPYEEFDSSNVHRLLSMKRRALILMVVGFASALILIIVIRRKKRG